MHKLVPIPNLLKHKEDDSLFIIGGGPSLTDFDWSILKNKNVLVLNRALEKVPNAIAVFWNDVTFHQNHQEELSKFGGVRISTTRYSLSHTCDCNIIWVKGNSYTSDMNGPIEESPYTIRQGSNTGYSALNVAYHLGAKTIYLLGYDMNLNEGKTNWHDGYKNEVPNNNRTRLNNIFIQQFNGVKKTYLEKGIKIYNLNVDSNLKEFETKAIEKELA